MMHIEHLSTTMRDTHSNNRTIARIIRMQFCKGSDCFQATISSSPLSLSLIAANMQYFVYYFEGSADPDPLAVLSAALHSSQVIFDATMTNTT